MLFNGSRKYTMPIMIENATSKFRNSCAFLRNQKILDWVIDKMKISPYYLSDVLISSILSKLMS